MSSMIVQVLNSAALPSPEQLKVALESKNEAVKIEAMKNILALMLNGNSLPNLLMHVIRFVMPSKNKTLKKLLYYFYEITPRHNPDGTLKQEFILACNAIRNDLQHPNEYIRGNTLRFVCRLSEAELVEPLVPIVIQSLEHRHAYVQKNAIWAIASLYNISSRLIPDGPSLIYAYLDSEVDPICRRNAFIALSQMDRSLAEKWILSILDSLTSMDESIQLAAIDFFRLECKANSEHKNEYLQVLYDFLETDERAVIYGSTVALTNLTNRNIVLREAASKLLQLISKESDNNARLIMLDRIEDIRQKQNGVLEDLASDVLQVLNSTDLDVRRRALFLITRIINAKNVDDIILVLKSELKKVVSSDSDNDVEYRRELTRAINECAVRHPSVVISVVDLLMESITDFSTASPVEVISFIREVIEKFEDLRKDIIRKLLDIFLDRRAHAIYRGALWAIGEYSETTEEIDLVWGKIRESIGRIPILESEQNTLEQTEELQNGTVDKKSASQNGILLPDGTYATQSALFSESASEAKLEAIKAKENPPLRALILEGDYFLATTLANTILKLVIQYASKTDNKSSLNSLKAESMLILTSIIRVGQSTLVKKTMDEDSLDQIMSYLRMLSDFSDIDEMKKVLLSDTRSTFVRILSQEEKRILQEENERNEYTGPKVDSLLSIRQLHTNDEGDALMNEDIDSFGAEPKTEVYHSDFNKIKQLTGFSDPIYAEAYVKINQFDIILEILIANHSKETLQNVWLNLAVSGDLKIVERPPMHTLAPHQFLNIQTTVKLSSTDTGSIFGNITFTYSNLDTDSVTLEDIQLNILDYIKPAKCSEDAFRDMWMVFEWENKIIVKSRDANQSLNEYLEALMKRTNLACLTPQASVGADCAFLSANLYAKSIFGEDALMNVSLEKQAGKPVLGHVRIRSKNQGIAASLGDLVNED